MKVLRILLVLILAVSMLAGCAGAPAGEVGSGAGNGEGYRQITMAAAAEEMKTAENFILLDVRRPDEFAAGYIPGAVNVPNETIEDKMPAELPDTEQLIYIYCRSGNRSKQASAKLVAMGYTNITEIGGINDWDGEVVTE